MKLLSILILISLTLINGADYPGAHYLILDDNESTIDGLKIKESQKDVFYNSASGEVTIKSPGTYILTGRLTGQLEVNVEENDKVTLVLAGVKITCNSAPAILFKGGYEFYQETGTITYEVARSLDFSNAGAKIIIADDSVNEINGSHSEKHDGAISSKISLAISAESKGNGILNVVADFEGIEVKNHLLIDGGVINIAAQDDGINVKEDSLSVFLMKKGQLTVNAGIGQEGDGVDSNGYLIIEGGTVFSAAKPQMDSGLDSNSGLVVNGGTVVGIGTAMDGAESLGSQPAMNLKFAEQVGANSVLKVCDNEGKELFSFSPSTLGFREGTEVKTYSGATISSPNFKLNTPYKLYLDNVQLGNSGANEATGGFFPGPPPGGNGGNGGGRQGPPPFNFGGGGGFDFGSMFSGCDSLKTMNSTEFTIAYSATSFSCVQKTTY